MLEEKFNIGSTLYEGEDCRQMVLYCIAPDNQRSKLQPIADCFFTGQGLRLQMLDSMVAANLMENFARQMGTVALLPVHDSFICHHGYETDVKAAMKAEFRKLFKTDIVVKRTSWDDDLTLT